jgi:hypothetical protein
LGDARLSTAGYAGRVRERKERRSSDGRCDEEAALSDTLVSTEARAVGIVTDHTSRRSYGTDHRVDVLFYPSMKFQTADGRTVEFQNRIAAPTCPLGWGIR